jgi:hypothetical protein
MSLYRYLKTSLKKTGIAAVFVAVAGYWFTYQDRIDARQERAWGVVRTAMEWSENKKWGNVGQIEAMQTLTRDCDAWWTGTPLNYVFGFIFRDCVPLKSLSLMQMDFGGLRAPGAILPYGYFACSNFSGAQLMRAHMDHTSLMAADMSGADLSGADLSGACLFYTDISNATLTDDTKIEPEALLKACVRQEKQVRLDIKTTSSTLKPIASKIPLCPEGSRCGLLSAANGWSCKQ